MNYIHPPPPPPSKKYLCQDQLACMAHFYCRVTGSVGKVTRSTMLQIGWTARGQSQSVWSSVLANHKQSFFLSWPIAISLSLLTNQNLLDHLFWPITVSLSLLNNHNLLDHLSWPITISLSLLTKHKLLDNHHNLSWPITISLSLLTNHNLLDYLFWPMKIRSHTDCFDQSQAISVLSVFCVHCPKNNLNLCTYCT